MYKPACAYACRAVLESSSLNCTSHGGMHMPGMDMHMGAETEPECYATDDAFLQTLAYCMSSRCQGTQAWELERYWKMNVAGRAQYVFHPQ